MILADEASSLLDESSNWPISRHGAVKMAQKMLSAGGKQLHDTPTRLRLLRSKSLGGTHPRRTRVRRARTSYPLDLKLRAVDEAERTDAKTAAVKLKLEERVVRRWFLQADDLRRAGLTNPGAAKRLVLNRPPLAKSDEEVHTLVSLVQPF